MVFRVKKCMVRDGDCRSVTSKLNFFLTRDTKGQEKKSCVRLPRILEWIGRMICGGRLLSFSMSAFYSFLKCLRYTANSHRRVLKNDNSGLGFWSPRRYLFSDPLWNRNRCLGRDPYLVISMGLMLIAYFTSRGVKYAAQTKAADPLGWPEKRSYHLQLRC